MKKTEKAFMQGYMCAVACLINSHGLYVEAKDLLSAFGNQSAETMRKNGVDDHDIKTFINNDLIS